MEILLKKMEEFILESDTWKFITIILAIMIVKTGIWPLPSLFEWRNLAEQPFTNPTPSTPSPFTIWNWLGLFITWSLGVQKNWWSFFLFLLASSFLFSFLYIKVVFKKFSSRVARTSLILFAMLPVSTTAYVWVYFDSFTIIFTLLAFAFSEYILVTILSGIALGMQHFDQTFLGAIAFLLAVICNKFFKAEIRYSLKFAVVYFLSVLVGKLILIGIFYHYSITAPTRLAYGLGYPPFLLTPIGEFLYHPHVCLWGVLGLGWFIALKYLDFQRKSFPFFLGFIFLLLILPISGDETRVFAISSFPLVLAFWLLNENFLSKISGKEIAFGFVLLILVPMVWVQGGKPKWSTFPYDIAQLCHALFGWFNVPSPANSWHLLWPFN